LGERDQGVRLAASALGLGYLPVAPGTWASAVAAAVYWSLRALPASHCILITQALFCVALLAGFAVCPRAQRVFGQADPGPFVLDELAGQWLTCLVFWSPDALAHAVGALLAFRLFDITKPFPLRRIEKLPGAWGVILDDLVAALYAAILLWVVRIAAPALLATQP